MSRAFVKEDDDRVTGVELPERSHGSHPNYVTPQGLAELERRVHAFRAECADLLRQGDALGVADKRRGLERELRYLEQRIDRAVLVDPKRQPRDQVAFGATVRVCEAKGRERAFRIVGEDEADAASGKVSWVSPLARALLGARIGEAVTWQRPGGAIELEVIEIGYD